MVRKMKHNIAVEKQGIDASIVPIRPNKVYKINNLPQ